MSSKHKKENKRKRGSKTIKRWSQEVSRKSNAMDLEAGVFTKSPKYIAKSIKSSVMKSKRNKRIKSSPYKSAMSMISFYINRAGKKLSNKDKKRLNRSKDELRKLFKRRN